MASLTEYYSIINNPSNVQPVKLEWSVKGYHAFRIHPHPQIFLKVELEENNPYDPNAMKVTVPSLDQIPPHLRDAVTKEGTGNRPSQTVRQIAGKQIGRVLPTFELHYQIITRGYVSDIVCYCTGEITLSTRPFSHQQFRRRRGNERHDQAGGGAELKCYYVVYLKRVNFESAMHLFEELLPREELESRNVSYNNV